MYQSCIISVHILDLFFGLNPLKIGNCKKYLLSVNFFFHFQQDCITLANVRSSLDQGTREHSALCEGQPVFSAVQDYGNNNLLMSCKVGDVIIGEKNFKKKSRIWWIYCLNAVKHLYIDDIHVYM